MVVVGFHRECWPRIRWFGIRIVKGVLDKSTIVSRTRWDIPVGHVEFDASFDGGESIRPNGWNRIDIFIIVSPTRIDYRQAYTEKENREYRSGITTGLLSKWEHIVVFVVVNSAKCLRRFFFLPLAEFDSRFGIPLNMLSIIAIFELLLVCCNGCSKSVVIPSRLLQDCNVPPSSPSSVSNPKAWQKPGSTKLILASTSTHIQRMESWEPCGLAGGSRQLHCTLYCRCCRVVGYFSPERADFPASLRKFEKH